jgi:alpha-1,6-mannosyltransferase
MQSKQRYVWAALLTLPIIAIGYWIDREESYWLLGLFAISFAGYFALVLKRSCTVKELLVIGILVRLACIGATPELSDDYYRFAFDGKMVLNGENPYTVLPDSLESSSSYETMLVENMNSPSYYSIYPPIDQIFFSLPTLIAGDNLTLYIIILRVLIILFEILMALLLLKMLQFLEKELHLFAWYFLNPLVIVELSGNLHFEGVTMFFFLLAVYLLMTGKLLRSGIVYAIAIGTKLIPLMLLPFFIHRLRKRSLVYFTIIAVTVVVLFIPFINRELISNLASSLDLYFHTFMFNGSLFYIANEVVEQFTGFEYNLDLLGSITPFVVLISVMVLAVSKNRSGWDGLMKQAVFALLIYYSLASIVHPWYVVNLMALALFTNYRFPYVWSALIVVSYVAYRKEPVEEVPMLLVAEHLALGIMVIVELLRELRVNRDSQCL